MKRIKLFAVSLILIAGSAASLFAVDFKSYPDSFTKGNIAINAGVGYGYSYSGSTVIPPISATVDYALPIGNLPFSIGGLVGFTSSQDTGTYYEYNYSVFALGARIAYHPNFGIKKLDAYFGTVLGYYIINYSYTATYSSDYTASAGSFLYGGYVGARYFFTNNFAAFAELGAGFTYATAGVTFKF